MHCTFTNKKKILSHDMILPNEVKSLENQVPQASGVSFIELISVGTV